MWASMERFYTIAVDSEVSDNMYQWSEFDYLN